MDRVLQWATAMVYEVLVILLVFIVLYIAGRCVGAGFIRSIRDRKDRK